MQLWGATQEDLATIVERVSAEQYGGNIRVGEGMQGRWSTQGSRVKRVLFGLRVNSSQGPGHRRSAGGLSQSKRMVAACWHAHRDVMAAIFDAFPDARLKTSLADYRGAGDFREAFPETYYSNIGSMMFPCYMGDACDCDE